MWQLRAKSILLLALLSAATLAFVTTPVSGQAIDSPTGANPSVGICTFYRLRLSRDDLRKIPVYIDGIRAFDIANGRWTKIEIPSGHHVIKTKDNQYGVELDLTPGEKYYFEVQFGERTRFHGVHEVITLSPPEQASYEIKRLKPLDSSQIFWTISRPAKP